MPRMRGGRFVREMTMNPRLAPIQTATLQALRLGLAQHGVLTAPAIAMTPGTGPQWELSFIMAGQGTMTAGMYINSL